MERSDFNGSSVDCPKNLLAIRARKEADEDLARLADQHLRQIDEFCKIKLELFKNLNARHALELALIKEGPSVAVSPLRGRVDKLEGKRKGA